MTDKSPENNTNKHEAHSKYRPDIDGLRAVAIISVVSFHAFPNFITGGFIGVDIFFVISGYLISSIIFGELNQNKFSFLDFYIRRIKRIFPALLAMMTTCFIAGWLILLPNEYKQLGKHIATGAGFVSNFAFWQESGYFDSTAETKPLLHLWSLGIEEQFYLIWPVILWITWKKKINYWIIATLITLASFLLNIIKINFDQVATFYSPQTRFWELMIGSIVAYVQIHNSHIIANIKNKQPSASFCSVNPLDSITSSSNPRNHISSLLGIILIGIGFGLIHKESNFPGWYALLPSLGAALLIAAGQEALVNRFVLSNRVLIWFGLISYPLYLWHWPLLSFARIIKSENPNTETICLAVATAVCLAWLTYTLIEKPIRFGRYSRQKAIALALSMCAVGSIGFYTYNQGGFELRFPKTVQDLNQYQYNFHDEYREFTCFLEPEQDYTAFQDCGVTRNKNKKTILIWGDSHAAHLYPGYKEIYGNSFNLIQRTAAICPPILNTDFPKRKSCKDINSKNIELIRAENPDRVVLSALWYDYDWTQVKKTISALKDSGIKNIDLIGQDPCWTDDLPKLLYKYFKNDTMHQIPRRMKFGLDGKCLKLNPLMKEFAAQQQVNYISPIDIMCNDEGCITRLGDTIESLTGWDSGHFTSVGSVYLVSQFSQFNYLTDW
ncbi:hypothetical protein A1507_04695 [Methylomonas koyamae]|uniref:Acyltransferase n=1 Tax=Methylomonas koyamae TaxID=702114 RepID=A0A177NRQ2_9GAMM|nr:acyltransferase family protein [Methylomonas koyamae]OAI20757.1 hypothetical protein A1507_04695 [Methylomonas koyamae]